MRSIHALIFNSKPLFFLRADKLLFTSSVDVEAKSVLIAKNSGSTVVYYKWARCEAAKMTGARLDDTVRPRALPGEKKCNNLNRFASSWLTCRAASFLGALNTSLSHLSATRVALMWRIGK